MLIIETVACVCVFFSVRSHVFLNSLVLGMYFAHSFASNKCLMDHIDFSNPQHTWFSLPFRYLLFIWNPDLTGYLVFLFAKSGDLVLPSPSFLQNPVPRVQSHLPVWSSLFIAPTLPEILSQAKGATYRVVAAGSTVCPHCQYGNAGVSKLPIAVSGLWLRSV